MNLIYEEKEDLSIKTPRNSFKNLKDIRKTRLQRFFRNAYNNFPFRRNFFKPNLDEYSYKLGFKKENLHFSVKFEFENPILNGNVFRLYFLFGGKMSYTNAYTAYQKTNVKTASQGHLIVLLYEAAIKNLRNALSLFDSEQKIKPGDIEKFSTFVQKAQAIITELQVSLDMEKGGDISKNLMSLYVYFNSELMDASINHNKEKINFVQNQMGELLSAWKSAETATASSAPQEARAALNIQG